jgi:hypothetical protein
LRAHDLVELRAPEVRAALRLVGERRFDLVVANEARAMWRWATGWRGERRSWRTCASGRPRPS